MIELRPYQSDAIASARVKMVEGKSAIVLCAPCGAGKTVIAAAILESAAKKGAKCVFVCHRTELVKQTLDKLFQAGVVATTCKNEFLRMDEGVCVITTQTLNKADIPTNVKLIVVDECHKVSFWSGTTKVVELNPKAKVLGLTATPYRLKRKESLAQHFDDLVNVATTQELLALGYLSPLRYFCPKIEGSESVAFNDTLEQQNAVINNDDNNRFIVRKYKDFCSGRLAIGFCPTIEHAEQLRDEFQRQGVSCAVLSHKSNKTQRDAFLYAMRSKAIHVGLCVDILTEGFDVPDIECVMLIRKTQSKALFAQMVGRGVRIADGKTDCIILDFVNNVQGKHGFYEDMVVTGLEEIDDKEPGEAPVRVCPECESISPIQSVTCDNCGYHFPIKEKKIPKVEDMVEIKQGDKQVKFLRTKAQQAMNRGYAPNWAEVQFKEKFGLFPKSEWRNGLLFGGKPTQEEINTYSKYLVAVANKKDCGLTWVNSWLAKESIPQLLPSQLDVIDRINLSA